MEGVFDPSWCLPPASVAPSVSDAPPLSAAWASSSETAPEGPSKKRARIVHPNFESLGACDQCRSRRVKCVRLQAHDRTCEECRRRKLECTNFRNNGLRYKPRAKKSDATKQDPPNALTVHGGDGSAISSAEGDSPGSDSSSSSSHRLSLSTTSIEGRLTSTEESSGLLATLVDSYLASSTFSPPVVKWDNLRARFERAGRRLHQLDPFTETLVLTLVAFGAFVSDHPLILGNDAPRLVDMDVRASSANLSVWSQRRQGFCQKLVDQVVDLVDRRGIFRVCSTESVVILALTCELMLYSGRESNMQSYRSAALAHSKRMKDEQTPRGDLGAGTEWGLAIGDAFSACVMGRMMTLSEEDVSELLGTPRATKPTLEKVHTAIFSADPEVYMPPVGHLWLDFVAICRDIARKIAIPLRKGKHVELKHWQDAYAETEALYRFSTSAHDLARKLVKLAPPQVVKAQIQCFGDTPASHFCTVPLAAIGLQMIQYQKFTIWRKRNEVFQEIDPSRTSDGPSEAAQIAELADAMTSSTVNALLFCAKVIRDPEIKPVSFMNSHLSMLAVLQKAMENAMQLTLEIPCAEEGGPASFPRHVKFDAAQAFIDAVRTQSWTWPYKQVAADTGQKALDGMRRAAGSTAHDRPALVASTSPFDAGLSTWIIPEVSVSSADPPGFAELLSTPSASTSSPVSAGASYSSGATPFSSSVFDFTTSGASNGNGFANVPTPLPAFNRVSSAAPMPSVDPFAGEDWETLLAQATNFPGANGSAAH